MNTAGNWNRITLSDVQNMFAAFNQQEVTDVSFCARWGMLVIILHSLCMCLWTRPYIYTGGHTFVWSMQHLNPDDVTVLAPFRTTDFCIQTQCYYSELTVWSQPLSHHAALKKSHKQNLVSVPLMPGAVWGQSDGDPDSPLHSWLPGLQRNPLPPGSSGAAAGEPAHTSPSGQLLHTYISGVITSC